MYGQRNYGHQTGQGPNGQHHLPAALPPPNSSQPLAASNSVMRRPPAAVPSQSNQLLPMFDRVPRGPPHVVNNGPPFQGPPSGMTNATNQSHASLPLPPPVLGRMPIPGPYLNSQHNPRHPLHVGTQNFHHFPTPSPPPPPPSKREFTHAAPLPPLVQGHTAYWDPVNSQPQQPSSVQGPPIPNPTSGLVGSAPVEIHSNSLAPPPHPHPHPHRLPLLNLHFHLLLHYLFHLLCRSLDLWCLHLLRPIVPLPLH